MKQFHVLAVLAVLMTVEPGIVRPCKVANWEPMTLAEQAAKAQIIVFGRIIAHYPMQGVPIDRAYIAEMKISCTIKGDLPHRVNISEAGRLTSCHHTNLPVNKTFITFLKQEEPNGPLVPDEVNHLSVAFEPTDANFKQVAEAVPDLLKRCTELEHLIGEGHEEGQGVKYRIGERDGDGVGVRDGGHSGASLVSASAVFIINSLMVLTMLRRVQLI